MRKIIALLSIIALITSCDTSKMNETDISNFKGKWKLVDRGMLDGIEIEITSDANNKFTGKVIKLNDNKYVKLFMEVGDKVVSGIKRNSNYSFTLSEKKVASELFAAYGQSTSSDYKAEFENNDKINLGESGSEGHYERIK